MARACARSTGRIAAERTAVEAVVQRAAQTTLGSGERQVTAPGLLIALAETPGCRGGALLGELGITPLALKLHVSQPSRPGLLRRLWSRARVRHDGDLVTVVLHNDRYTTKEFVVEVLQQHFTLSLEAAMALMRDVHERGQGHIHDLPSGLALRRIDEVTRLARERGYPLRLTIESAAALPRAELLRD
jgi:ATP-dependent Clp protease adaptor protein ClpS